MRKTVGHKIDAFVWKDEDGLVRNVDLTIDDRVFQMNREELWILYTHIENCFNLDWFETKHKQPSTSINSIEKTAPNTIR